MNNEEVSIELEIIKQDLSMALNGYQSDWSWMQPRKLLSKERIKKLDEVFLRLNALMESLNKPEL